MRVKILLAMLGFLCTTPTIGQQMFKCTVNGKVAFQQMPCSPTQTGERMPVKALPGTGEGLRESELDLATGRSNSHQDTSPQQSLAQPAVPAQPPKISYEDEVKIENLNKSLNSRFITKDQQRGIRDQLRQIYSKYGMDPLGPEPPTTTIIHSEESRHAGPQFDATTGRWVECAGGACHSWK